MQKIETVNSITHLFRQFSSVSSMCFSAASRDHSEMGWNGQGQAAVYIETGQTPEGRLLRLTEKGHFSLNGQAQAIPFFNVIKLILFPEHISFSHERYGIDRPVWLFDIVASDQVDFYSQTPHLCGQDNYALKIRLEADAIVAHWSITGPKKNERLIYHYALNNDMMTSQAKGV